MTASARVQVTGLGICLMALMACGARQSGAVQSAGPRTAAAQTSHFASPYTYEWFVRAELLRAKGQLAQAVEAYRAAIAGADDDATLLARLGSALAEHGEYEEAQRTLDEAAEISPDAEELHLARAELCERKGDLDCAITALEQAPQSTRALLRLSSLLRAHGYLERARAVLERFRARSFVAGRLGNADVHQAELEDALASGDPDAVFEATLPYRLGYPPAAGPLTRAATLLLERQHPVLALRLLELVPEAERSQWTQLRALLAVGRPAALESFLVLHEPSTSEERVLAARAALRAGKLEDAALFVDAERLLHPDLPVLQLLAAQIELARAHYAAAAGLFVQVPRAATVGAEAKLGLTQALEALGLPELAAEVRAAQ